MPPTYFTRIAAGCGEVNLDGPFFLPELVN